MFDKLKSAGFQLDTTNHAEAILEVNFSQEAAEIEDALLDFRIPARELIESGGGEAPFTQRLRRRLADVGWVKHNFKITKSVDGAPRESTSHEIDHIRTTPLGTLALEIEWNNKSEFYDRDLENFKRLHAEGVFSVAILVTRGESFQNGIDALVKEFAELHQVASFTDLERFTGYEPTRKFKEGVENAIASSGGTFRDVWVRRFVSNKYGQSTTHWNKLQDRIRRGVGNPCPMVLIGLPISIVDL